jgi:surfactin synthase thioesterase subunit
MHAPPHHVAAAIAIVRIVVGVGIVSVDLMLPILRNDFRACETYSAPERPPLRTEIVAYGGLADEDADRDALLAWARETLGRFVLRLFPGGHFFVRECASRVAATLQRDMAEALSLSEWQRRDD